MQLGCSTILYGGHSLDIALAGIARAGYAAIELCAIPGMADHLPVDRGIDFYSNLRKQIGDAGLAIESIGASTNLLDDDRRARFVRLTRIAGLLGAPAITTGSGGVADDSESFRQVIRAVKEVASIAADVGVRLSIKPHVRNAVYSTRSSLEFMAAADTTVVGLNFDASHLWRCGEIPEDSLKQLARYVVTARIRDTLSRDIPIGSVDTQLPGGGAMNLRAICRMMRTLPIEYAVLEIVGTRDWSSDMVQSAIVKARDSFIPLLEGG